MAEDSDVTLRVHRAGAMAGCNPTAALEKLYRGSSARLPKFSTAWSVPAC